MRTIFSVFLLSLSPILYTHTFAQNTVNNQSQLWMGYMTSTEFSKHYSWWNDAHYVPEGFFIVRTGITRQINKLNITGGYAHAWLPLSTTDTRLHRNENRLWGQAQFSLPLSKTLTFTQRTRYDGRFIQNVSNGEPTDGSSFINRIRFMASLRKNFSTWNGLKATPFVSLGDEVLFHFGKNITGLDFNQNRIYLTLGLQKSRMQYQIGYMDRFVRTGTDKYVHNHTLILWVTQKFSVRKNHA